MAGWMSGTTFTPAAGAVELALSTANPTFDVSALAEPSGGGYARQATTLGTNTTISNVRRRANTAPVVFNATANWGTISHGVLYRGTVAYWQGPLNAQKLTNAGNSVSFANDTVEVTAGPQWSNFARDLILNAVTGGALTAPAGFFIGLSTADPLADASGLAEPTGNYARQSITFTETSNTSAGIIIGNNTASVFGPASTNWGNITHAAIFDAASGGNMIAYGPVAVQRNIVSGDAYGVPINSLALTVR